MTFATGALTDQANVGSGEKFGTCHAILTAITFEDGLKVGRFAKLDTGSIDNFDGSATPVVVGVVQRNVPDAVENDGVLDADTNTKIQYIRQGFVTVDVKTGETPALFGRVYASNAGDANDGLATATNTDIDVNAEFIKEIKTDVWLIYVTPAPGDVATHIADAAAAHAASAISLLDTAGLTAQDEVEAVIAEILVRIGALIADPGDAGAIPVTRSGNVALTTGGSGETRTLAIPGAAGTRLVLSHDVDGGGDAVITVASAANQAGNNTLTMADAGDIIELIAVQVASALVWRIGANDGVALSTV
ncbi:hypothetical protein KAR91_23590 [Candidatus Pacearchaeota archaeon]|nr:hypothetical protein [Candidatus Pacearchaeota archaeon]